METFQLLAPVAFLGLVQPNNYSDDKSWLCRPGRHDACDVDLTTTVIALGGKLSRETWIANSGAPVVGTPGSGGLGQTIGQ